MSYINAKDCLVVDRFPLIRDSLSRILSDLSDYNLVHQTGSVETALKLIETNNIGLIVLDVNLDQADGFELLRKAYTIGYSGKAIYVSSYGYPIYSETAYKLGANGYISKSEEPSLIKDAICGVSRGHNLFKTDYRCTKRNLVLSQRETVVYNYLKKGYSNKQISEFLGLSAKTISTYKARILDKYQVGSIVELLSSHEVIGSEMRLAS
jgi:two-component system response regulator FimZ (fimbrial Z protein)